MSELNLALELGKLIERVNQLEQRTLVREPPVDAITPRIWDVIRGYGSGRPELMRHLESVARELLAKQTDENGVIDALHTGAGG